MTTSDAEGRSRRAVYLPDELWAWLETTAARDGTSRSDLLEGLVLLEIDHEEAKQLHHHVESDREHQARSPQR